MNNVIQGFPEPQQNFYKVYVRSITYNQSKYIEDCLKGVAIQETNFPFVHHIIDDCSTDGEQEVIKLYMDKNCDLENAEYYDNDICTITIAKYKANTNCTLVVYFLKKNMYGNKKKGDLYTPWRNVCPYEAYCEGDDYWIHPQKLQMQADYLDAHSDYSICFSNVKVWNEPKQDWKSFCVSDDVENDTDSRTLAERGNYIHTPSIMLRICVDIYPQMKKLGKVVLGDYSTWLFFSQKGKIHKLDEQTSVYRSGVGVWENSKVSDQARLVDTMITICKVYPFLDNGTQENLEKQIDGLRGYILETDKELNNLRKSKRYRIGKFIVDPFAKLSNFFRGFF